jgi:hypothetical protein
MPVLIYQESHKANVKQTCNRYGLELIAIPADTEIPGSYWQGPEAGLIDNRLYIRPDTPIHSLLHEACHYICMDRQRRQELHTDAGGDYEEENGVCYLQILLANHIKGMGCQRMMADMDEWGYTFRLGSARDWFEQDAQDARQWLLHHGLIDGHNQPSWQLRDPVS